MDDLEIVPADRPGAYLLRLDGQDQSHVDLDDPTRLAFDYVRRIGDVLDLCAPPREPLRVAHVGGAAMTLPRYVAATRPRSWQVVMEPAAAVTELVRAELPLPARSGVKVRPVDGCTGVAALPDAHVDVLVVDAFAGGRVPADLVTTAFVEQAARVLRPEGLLLFNLSDRAPFRWTRRVVAGVRQHLEHVLVSAEPATLRARRGGNLLLVASRGGVPTDGLRERARSSAAPYRVLGAAQVSDTLGGGIPFTVEDSEPSPAP